MAQLDEINGPTMEQGNEVHVIAQKLPAKAGKGTKFLNILMYCLILPAPFWAYAKVKAKQYFEQLQQKIQSNASTIDNYLENRVMILQNVAPLVEKAIKLDKETFAEIAKYRSGGANNDTQRSDVAAKIEGISREFNMVMEQYPDLKAHHAIADAMQQNAMLQREITAAKDLYNDSVERWNKEIYHWPIKLLVAEKEGYTTRIPFIASKEIKEKAKGVFF